MSKIMIIFVISVMQLYSSEIDKIPVSFTYKSELKPLTIYELLGKKVLKSFNNDSLKIVKNLLMEKYPDSDNLYGIEEKVNFSPSNSGTWDTLENGSRIWRLIIKSPGATSINMVVRNIYFERNSRMYIYSYDKTDILQPFYWRNNNSKKIISTFLVKGEEVIVEYYEPKDFNHKSDFIISKIVHGYEDILIFSYELFKNNNEKIQSELDCHRDVNCPEGVDFCREKYSVAMILAPDYQDNWGYCTGSLINNVKYKYKPYFLTAFHALDHIIPDGILSDDEKNNVEEWSFRFGYIREICDSGSSLTYHDYNSGAEFKSAWVSTDFALLELNDQPEPGEGNFPGVFFNGWDRTGAIPDNTTYIHHPDGDLMKISIDEDSPVITGLPIDWKFSTSCTDEENTTYYWRVNCESGSMEGGSSGAPIYDNNRRVIGQHRKGSQYTVNGTRICAVCNEDRIFYSGRFYHSWTGGGTNDTRLSNWLDPDNTGASVLDGIHIPNNQWGHIVQNTETWNRNAYSVLRVGSDDTPTPFRVESGGHSTLKAGKEIQILPCTQILAGSEFRAYIEELDCDDEVALSDPERNEELIGCGEYSLLQQRKDFTDIEINKLCGYKLSHNIPNPFSGTTEIIYSLPKPSHVVVQVYNSIGMPIKVLVDAQQNAGEYKVIFDASGLSDGVYFYTMRTPEFIETKQMVLMR